MNDIIAKNLLLEKICILCKRSDISTIEYICSAYGEKEIPKSKMLGSGKALTCNVSKSLIPDDNTCELYDDIFEGYFDKKRN